MELTDEDVEELNKLVTHIIDIAFIKGVEALKTILEFGIPPYLANQTLTQSKNQCHKDLAQLLREGLNK